MDAGAWKLAEIHTEGARQKNAQVVFFSRKNALNIVLTREDQAERQTTSKLRAKIMSYLAKLQQTYWGCCVAVSAPLATQQEMFCEGRTSMMC